MLKNAKEISSDILNIIMPKGKYIGNMGSSTRIRELSGGTKAAEKMFKKLSKNGKLIHSEGLKKIYKLSDNTFITYRSNSTSGPPTIDIKLPKTKNNIKLKFLEKK